MRISSRNRDLSHYGPHHPIPIGLEEAVAEQDSAISDLMSAALRSFERLHTGDAGASKAIRRTATITRSFAYAFRGAGA